MAEAAVKKKDQPAVLKMATRKPLRTSGWCCTAQDVERGITSHGMTVDELHSKCPGIALRPVGYLPWRCDCYCHENQILETPQRQQKAVERARKVLTEHGSGKRDGHLLDEIYRTLTTVGEIEFDAPSDPKQNKSLRERIYTAARRKGMKVKVVNDVARGKIVGTVKDRRPS